MKRYFFKIMIALFIMQMIYTPVIFAADKKEEITLQLRWEHQFQFAGYYAALWKGFYEEAGLDVTIKSGFDEKGQVLIAPTEVAEGRAEFGVGAVDVLFAIDEGKDLTLVSSIFQKSAVAYYMLDTTKFNSIYDFTKLRVARRKNDLLDIELQAMLLSEGLKPNKQEGLPEETILTVEDLINRKYDVIPEYLDKITYQANMLGYSIKKISPVDFGIDFYGDSLFTTTKMVEADPKVVENFRQASIKGWEYALDHPEEITMKIINSYYQESEAKEKLYEYNLFQSEKVKELTLYPVVQTGNINEYRWRKMTDFLKELNLISQDVKVEDHIFDFRKIQEQESNKKAKYYQYLTAVLIIFIIIIYMIYVTNKNKVLRNEINYRKSVEEKIKRNNERYQTLFDSSFLGITVTNRNGEILQTNNKWSEMTGYSQEELKTMKIFDIVDKETVESGKKEFKKLRDGEVKSIELERCYTRKNNTLFWGQLFMTTIIDPETEEQAFLGMVLDITRRNFEREAVKRAEERFRKIINDVALEVDELPIQDEVDENKLYDGKSRLSLKLERINIKLENMFKKELDENKKNEAMLIYQARLAAMGEMVANIAHQWRQPLNNLGILLSNLEDSYHYKELDAKEMSNYMKRAKSLIKNMSETIDDFRDFLKPKATTEPFHVKETINSILNMLKENFEFNNVIVEFQCQEDYMIHGSRNHYGQAVFNVLNNAIDSLVEQAESDKKIIVKVTREKELIKLLIKDNGLGIKPEFASKIFDPYFTTKDENKGTGLGLYMVKNIIEGQLNGSIKLVETSKGAGFLIEVPEKPKS